MKPVFYLKTNRHIDYAYTCIKFWIDVAQAMGSKFYIICDSENIRKEIMRRFHAGEENFIRSMTEKTAYISAKVADSRWKKASDAHLTAFFHAVETGAQAFWNIDADDTMFCLSNEKMASVIDAVQRCSEDIGVPMLGLDMWWTFRDGNWSFGMTYVNTGVLNWIGLMERYMNDYVYTHEQPEFNLDSYFNHMRNKEHGIIESFYVKNTDFIHWGGVFGPMHYKFRDGKVVLPKRLTYMVARSLKAGECRIRGEVIPIDAGIAVTDGDAYRAKKYLKSISSDYGMSPALFGIRERGLRNMAKNGMAAIKGRLYGRLATGTTGQG